MSHELHFSVNRSDTDTPHLTFCPRGMWNIYIHRSQCQLGPLVWSSRCGYLLKARECSDTPENRDSGREVPGPPLAGHSSPIGRTSLGLTVCLLKWFSTEAGGVAGTAFLGRVGTRTCSDLGHRVEGGKWTTALLAVALSCSFQHKHCSSPFALPFLLISEVHPAVRWHRDQPRFGSRLSFEVGTYSGDVFLTLQLPNLPTPPCTAVCTGS